MYCACSVCDHTLSGHATRINDAKQDITNSSMTLNIMGVIIFQKMCIAITFETGEPLQQWDITLNTYTK